MHPFRPSFLLRCLMTCGVAALALLGVHTAVQAAAAEPPTIVSGTLTVGSDLTYPPYAYLNGDEPAGLDPDFLDKLSAHLQLKPHFVDTRFANLILGINAKRIDIIASALYVTPERAKQIDFVPYFKTGGSLLAIHGGDFRPQSPADLCGKRVSSIKGASWIPKLTQVSKDVCTPKGLAPIDVREFETSPQAAQALLAHAVDAQFEDSAVAKITVDKMSGRLAITSTTPLFPVVVGLGVSKGNPALLAAVKGALRAMKQDGEYEALLKRYNVAEPSTTEIAAATGITN